VWNCAKYRQTMTSQETNSYTETKQTELVLKF